MLFRSCTPCVIRSRLQPWSSARVWRTRATCFASHSSATRLMTNGPSGSAQRGGTAELADGDPVYPNCEYASTAAEAGLGVSLAYEAVVGATVKEGRLVRLFEATTIPFTIYAIATLGARRHDPLIGAFREWLLAEAREHAPNGAPIRAAE